MVPRVTASEGSAEPGDEHAVEDAEERCRAATTIGTATRSAGRSSENFEKRTAPKASVEASEMSISPRMTTTARPSARMPGKTNCRVDERDLVEAEIVGREIGRPGRGARASARPASAPIAAVGGWRVSCRPPPPAHAGATCRIWAPMTTSAVAAPTIAVPWMNIRQNSGTRRRTRPLSIVASTTAPSAAPTTRARAAGDADPADDRGGERGQLPARGEDHGHGADARRVEEAGEAAEDAADDVGEEDDALGAEAEEGARRRVGADGVDAPAERIEAEEQRRGARR